MSDQSEDQPDVISSLEKDTLTFGDLEEVQDHESVDRAIDTETTKEDGVRVVTAFVIDMGDRSYAVRSEDEGWRIIGTAETLGDALALFDDED